MPFIGPGMPPGWQPATTLLPSAGVNLPPTDSSLRVSVDANGQPLDALGRPVYDADGKKIHYRKKAPLVDAWGRPIPEAPPAPTAPSSTEERAKRKRCFASRRTRCRVSKARHHRCRRMQVFPSTRRNTPHIRTWGHMRGRVRRPRQEVSRGRRPAQGEARGRSLSPGAGRAPGAVQSERHEARVGHPTMAYCSRRIGRGPGGNLRRW